MEILLKINHKNKEFKKIVKSKDQVNKIRHHLAYKALKNELNLLVKTSKITYYRNYFVKHKENLQKTWQGIKDIINVKNKNMDFPSCIYDNDQNITDPTEIADKFNNFYTSIADNILKEV